MRQVEGSKHSLWCQVRMCLTLLGLVVGLSAISMPLRGADQPDPEFLKKLGVMAERTEKSIKILRDQITQNQSAPFLADLYMQLGDLLAEKSNVLYYQQMERDSNTDLKVLATKKFSPVVQAQEEAIGIYKLILKDFPKFDKRDKVLYRLALAQKSIDETAAFVETAETLLKEFPKTKEAMQVRLLLGNHHFEQQEYAESEKVLTPAKESSYPFERNAARYRIGLIYMNQEKFADALKLFESVAADDELKEDDNPLEISLKSKGARSNVKREALIDSVRAYTEVYKQNPEPVVYYSRICPTETLFQEVIEKLAFRYIFLKKYTFAIKLLRTLSERTSDPQKIMNIYQEVLVMIPLMDRIDVPVEEIQFVLEKYNFWASFYDLKPEVHAKSYGFFETQVRELGTRSHDLAKKEIDPKRKEYLLDRAKAFYNLYLGFFEKGKETVKIAIDLADVYYQQKQYFQSGTYYLRTFEGDFGQATAKKDLIENAILSLQKKTEYSFYEQIRVKGLLIKAIHSYMAFDKGKRNDPQLQFTLAKTMYEQGLYDRALQDLLDFMKKNPNSSKVEPSADLILDYFNIRSDFKGIADWCQKILNLRLPNQALNKRIETIRSKALLKKLDEQVKTAKGFDTFQQGKSYLETALSMKDESLRSAALEQALGRSKAEKDIDTFVRAAGIMAKKEKDATKRAAVMNSVADETLAVTRFYQTLGIWKDIYTDKSYPENVKVQAFEKSVKLVLMLKDLTKLSQLMKSPMWRYVSDDSRRSVRQQLVEVLDSPVEAPSEFVELIDPVKSSDDELLSFFKAQFKIPANAKAGLANALKSRCSGSVKLTVCKWAGLVNADRAAAGYIQSLDAAPPKLEMVDKMAKGLGPVLTGYKQLENGGDPQLDMVLALKNSAVYEAFGNFLKREAQANKAVEAVLNQKANETYGTAKQLKAQCVKIMTTGQTLSPVNKYCRDGKVPGLREALEWKKLIPLARVDSDPMGPEIAELQKKTFVNHKDPQNYLNLAEKYLAGRNVRHASAASLYGLSTFSGDRDDFSAILGCAVMDMGLFGEAGYHFKTANNYNGLKAKCQGQLKSKAGEF